MWQLAFFIDIYCSGWVNFYLIVEATKMLVILNAWIFSSPTRVSKSLAVNLFGSIGQYLGSTLC